MKYNITAVTAYIKSGGGGGIVKGTDKFETIRMTDNHELQTSK